MLTLYNPCRGDEANYATGETYIQQINAAIQNRHAGCVGHLGTLVRRQDIRRYQVYRVRKRHRMGYLARLRRRLVQALYPPSESSGGDHETASLTIAARNLLFAIWGSPRAKRVVP